MTSLYFTFEELATLLTQVEACLYSRTFIALSSDPGDHQALIPGHLSIGGSLLALLDNDVSEVPLNQLRDGQPCRRLLIYSGNAGRRNIYLHYKVTANGYNH